MNVQGIPNIGEIKQNRGLLKESTTMGVQIKEQEIPDGCVCYDVFSTPALCLEAASSMILPRKSVASSCRWAHQILWGLRVCLKEGSTGFSRRKAANPTRVECQIAGQFPVTAERLKVVRRQLKWNNRGSYLRVLSICQNWPVSLLM